MKYIVHIILMSFVLISANCANANDNKEVQNLFEDIKSMAEKADTFTIDYAVFAYDDSPPPTTGYVDNNVYLSIIFKCESACINSAITTIKKMENLQHIPCSGKTIYRSKFYYRTEEHKLPAIYIGNYGKELQYMQKCYRAEKQIKFIVGKLDFF